MQDLYAVLGVRRGATVAEIRSAFRKKAKALHPDATGRADARNIEAFHEAVFAYNTLIAHRTRGLFDRQCEMRRASGEEREPFDYHKWLLARGDDESMAKLVFWDLMHGRESDAAEEFCALVSQRSRFSMRHWFSREDFMDLGYILAEELDARQHYYEAFGILAEIITMEREKSYFRLFFSVVLEFALRILKCNIESGGNDELSLDAYERAIDLDLGAQEDAFFLNRMAAIYGKMGDVRMAEQCKAAALMVNGGNV